jgi:hypothetical protein
MDMHGRKGDGGVGGRTEVEYVVQAFIGKEIRPRTCGWAHPAPRCLLEDMRRVIDPGDRETLSPEGIEAFSFYLLVHIKFNNVLFLLI